MKAAGGGTASSWFIVRPESVEMDRITSFSNKKIKEAAALLKKASQRRDQREFIAEGPKIFAEIPPEMITRVFAGESLWRAAPEELREEIEKHEAYIVEDDIFAKISDTKTPQAIMAQVCMREPEDVCAAADAYVITERLQDPGNLGTIIRSAEAAGFAVIMDRGTVDIYSPKVVRSTMGAILRVPFMYTGDLAQTAAHLREKGVRIYAAHLRGERPYDREDYTGASAFLIGNESAGLSDEAAALADTYIRIPMLGRVESLNASVAASVLMFEAARQRRRR